MMTFKKWLYFLLVLVFIISSNIGNSKEYYNEQFPNLISDKEICHRSVTFIVGEDKSDNKYYTNAAQYFRQHDMGTNNKVIVSNVSLVEILEYLNTISDNERWDKINIVSHGNEWTGLAMKVMNHGGRTVLESLVLAQVNHQIPILKDNIFDENSHVVLYACGLGLNRPIMEKLKEVFSTNINPKLSSTKLFNLFSVGKTISVHSLAFFYNSFYKPNNTNKTTNLKSQLLKRYPDVDIDWEKALKRKYPNFPGQAFSYQFKIPISWTEIYSSDANRPLLKTEEEITTWIKEQPEFLSLIKQYDIPLDKYKWTVKYKVNSKKYTKSMTIKGRTVVKSVLMELIDPVTKAVYIPNLHDERYFLTL